MNEVFEIIFSASKYLISVASIYTRGRNTVRQRRIAFSIFFPIVENNRKKKKPLRDNNTVRVRLVSKRITRKPTMRKNIYVYTRNYSFINVLLKCTRTRPEVIFRFLKADFGFSGRFENVHVRGWRRGGWRRRFRNLQGRQ